MSELPKVVDKQGREIKLTSYQKNSLYRNAKKLKEQLTDKMCSKAETEHATPRNVQKMLNSEFKARPQIETYVKSMQAINADPRDWDSERIRRR